MNRCIKNVFVSAGDNNLRLVDIYFNEKIVDIVNAYENIIPWEKIRTNKARLEFIDYFTKIRKEESTNKIDGKFILAIPGGIDAHVHFNTPGYEDREDFEHGSLAAANGGVTTVIDMPCTSIPPVTSYANMQKKLSALKNRSLTDFAFWGGIRGNDFEDEKNIGEQIFELHEAGVVGFKTYMTSGMDTFSDLTESQLLETARLLKSINGIMAVHAEDKNLIDSKYRVLLSENKVDWQAYCKARDVEAEVVAVEKLIRISETTGCRIHIVHLSSAEALNLIRESQSRGITISAETCPHYLYFTQKDFNNAKISAFLKTAPPVKSEVDREALWDGLRDGTISFVTTDHAGCDPEKEKSSSNFWEIYGGIPGVEHRIPFLFSEGLFKRNLTISQIIDLLSTNAAVFFNLKGKGSLETGKDADIVLIDLWEESSIDSEKMHSKGKYTPLQGVKLNTVIRETILRGILLMDSKRSIKIEHGYGRFIMANSDRV